MRRSVPQKLKSCHNEPSPVAANEMLRARVEKDLARKMQRWAKEHDMDLSEAIRTALRRFLKQEDVARKERQEIKQLFDEAERLGVFDPPKGDWKMGGFR